MIYKETREEPPIDFRHAPRLAALKAERMKDFLDATKTAAALDIQGDDEAAQMEFVRLIALREEIMGEIDKIDDTLRRLEPDRTKSRGEDIETVRRFLEQARERAVEAASLSRDLEASLSMACRSLRKKAAGAGNPFRSPNKTYGMKEENEASPRFLDTRL